MTRLFYGYFGWMCYDCRRVFKNLWEGMKNQFTDKCCKRFKGVNEND